MLYGKSTTGCTTQVYSKSKTQYVMMLYNLCPCTTNQSGIWASSYCSHVAWL